MACASSKTSSGYNFFVSVFIRMDNLYAIGMYGKIAFSYTDVVQLSLLHLIVAPKLIF